MLMVALPYPAGAYFTTGQSATKTDDGSIIFEIDYAFGSPKYTVEMPVLTKMSDALDRNAVSYEILDEEGNKASGTAVGVVFSKAKLLRTGEYRVARNDAEHFTLAVVYTPPPPLPTVGGFTKKYRLHVTNLPFTFNGDQPLQLNPSELQYYTTELVSSR